MVYLKHCIADLIDLHYTRAINFLQKPIRNMSKYYSSKVIYFHQKSSGLKNIEFI